jgi:preprotein translocase subunit Sss1
LSPAEPGSQKPKPEQADRVIVAAAALVLVGIVGGIVYGVQELLERRRERHR